MKMAIDLAEKLKTERGESVAVYSVHTLKPLDKDGIARVRQSFARVAVIEEHVEQGGLAAQVKQIGWDSRASCKLHTFSLKNEFLHVYGSQDDIRRAHGLSLDQIYPQVTKP
jgi:transketolase